MNWLAHLALSPPLFEVQLGNLVTDAVSTPLWDGFSDELCAGRDLHLRIDAASDAHPAFKEAKKLIDLERRALVPVVLDIVFDYHLHYSWNQFHNQSFESLWSTFMKEYRQREYCYEIDSFISLLDQHDVLLGYKHYSGLEHALYRLENRLKRRGRVISLRSAMSSIRKNEGQLNECFVKLYADLKKLVVFPSSF